MKKVSQLGKSSSLPDLRFSELAQTSSKVSQSKDQSLSDLREPTGNPIETSSDFKDSNDDVLPQSSDSDDFVVVDKIS